MAEYEPASYWEARLRRNPNLAGVGFLPYGEAYNRWLYRARERTLEGAVGELRNKHVLDLGAGIGHFSRWAAARGASVAALDLTEVAVERLRHDLPSADVRRGSVADPLPSEWRQRFDVVLVLDVLYHVPVEEDFEAALDNASAALAPGGIVAITYNVAGAGDHVHPREQGRYRAALERNGLDWRPPVAVAARLNRPSAHARWVRRFRLGGLVGAGRYWLDSVRPREPTLWLVSARRPLTPGQAPPA